MFSLIVGAALISRHSYDFPTWGIKKLAKGTVKHGELVLECEVSKVIGNMPFLWLSIDDEAGPKSRRDSIERNAIALLSNYSKAPLDPPSRDWLGHYCDRVDVRNSGLWLSDHVDKDYDPAFLDELDRLISAAGAAS
jgi:hypothetical protein